MYEEKVYYRIDASGDTVQFDKAQQNEVYHSEMRGFVRKAIQSYERGSNKDRYNRFIDSTFTLPQSSQYLLTRISDIYDIEDKEVKLFSPNQSPSIVKKQQYYCSFLCESGLLNLNYLKTLFITQHINKEGRYTYFVKRSGDYYLEECDDLIPVDKKTWKPLWGLGHKHPWELVLLKAWIKQCGGWDQMMRAKPFDLIDAFGLPSYKTFNFRKQIHFLKQQQLQFQKKKKKIDESAMNNDKIQILASTISNQNLLNVGLVPNKAAYTITPIKDERNTYYLIKSVLPCQWVGQLTPVTKTNLNQIYSKHNLNLENSFLMNEEEVLKYFNKVYAAPKQLTEISQLQNQDCFQIEANGSDPVWMKFQVEGKQEKQNLCSISLILPKNSSDKYPDLKYFLAKENNEKEIQGAHRSRIGSKIKMEEKDNSEVYGSSTCDKWSLFAIDFMQGYCNFTTLFTKLVPGNYALYVHCCERTKIKMRIDSSVHLKEKPFVYDFQMEKKTIVDSVFYDLVRQAGVEAGSKYKGEWSVSFMSNFDEFGFGVVSIQTPKSAKSKIAIRAHIPKLQQNNLRLLPVYSSQADKDIKLQALGQNQDDILTLITEKGVPQVIVVQKIINQRQSSIGKTFPPPGAIEFLKIMPKAN